MRWAWILGVVCSLGWATACGSDGSSSSGDAGSGGDSGSGNGGSGGSGANGASGGSSAHGGSGGDAGDSGTLPDGSHPNAPKARGLFIDEAALTRARARQDEAPFRSSYQLVLGRARTARDNPLPPFEMADVTTIRYGWCGADRGQPGTLSKATSDFEAGSDQHRTLALAYALTEDPTWAEASVAQMLNFANKQTLVNLYDLGANLREATLDGQTQDFCSDRPWNFALDALFQCYGLINASDAYLLLTRNGYTLSPADDEALRGWLRRGAEAVNSSLRAWTEWADAHPSSGSFERYRSDNHLSWALSGLIAAAAALEDDSLAAYVLDGGSFADSRGGPYANPSSIQDVIDRAIEGGEHDGRMYEERILRDPPVGYSMYHLWAMSLVAQVAEVHYERDVWAFTGADGAGMHHAFVRYADHLMGRVESPRPDQDGDLRGHRWLYELADRRWDEDSLREPLTLGAREQYIVQSIGPVSLLLGR